MESVTLTGDALAPATIAHAVYAEGRRYAERLGEANDPDLCRSSARLPDLRCGIDFVDIFGNRHACESWDLTVSPQRDFVPSPRLPGEGARRADEGRYLDLREPLTRRIAPPSPRGGGGGGGLASDLLPLITTGTWSEGFSQPRTCLSILQTAQA